MLKMRGKAPRGRTAHENTNVHKAARCKKTETRQRKTMVCNPTPAPPTKKHKLSLKGTATRSGTRYDKYVTKKNKTRKRLPRPLYGGNATRRGMLSRTQRKKKRGGDTEHNTQKKKKKGPAHALSLQGKKTWWDKGKGTCYASRMPRISATHLQDLFFPFLNHANDRRRERAKV